MNCLGTLITPSNPSQVNLTNKVKINQNQKLAKRTLKDQTIRHRNILLVINFLFTFSFLLFFFIDRLVFPLCLRHSLNTTLIKCDYWFERKVAALADRLRICAMFPCNLRLKSKSKLIRCELDRRNMLRKYLINLMIGASERCENLDSRITSLNRALKNNASTC